MSANVTTVNKMDLLGILQDNRDRHRAAFDAAMDGYRARVVKELEDRIELIKLGKTPNLIINLPTPKDHTKDYDRVLRMVEMHTGTTYDLDEDAFAAYVEDDWQWKREFVGTNAYYVGEG